jgi:hypothetical protein
VSGNEGNGPDPTEYTGPASPAAEGDYLSAAANWLALAEQDLRNATIGDAYPYAESARLAELNIALATACGTYHDRVPQRFAIDPAAMIREQLAADVEREQAQELHPATDGAPPNGQGDLWVVDREGPWFVYNVQGMPGAPLSCTQWLLVRHHSQVLRWRDEQGPRPQPMTWQELPDQGITTLMRPTDKERETFYGAPANPVPAPWITQPVPDGEGGQIDASATEAPCDCCASGLFNGGETCYDCDHGPELHAGGEVDAAPTPPEHACGRFDSGDNGSNPITRSSICERCGASAQAHIQVGLRFDGMPPEAAQPIPVRHVQAEPVATAPRAWFPANDTELRAWLDGLEFDQLDGLVRTGLDVRAAHREAPRPRGGATQWREG